MREWWQRYAPADYPHIREILIINKRHVGHPPCDRVHLDMEMGGGWYYFGIKYVQANYCATSGKSLPVRDKNELIG